MKKYFAAAALLMMMAACGSAGQDKKLEGTTWKLAKMEAIPAAADMQYEDAFVKMLDEVDRFEIKGAELTLFDDHKALAVFKAVEKEPAKQ